MNRHLNESDLTELLCGTASPELHAHISACDACSAELAILTGALKAFNQDSLVASRRQAELHPIDTAILGAINAPSRNRSFWRTPWALNWAAAVATATIVFAVTLPLTLHHAASHQSAAVTAPAAPVAAPDTADDIANDNQMLAEIDAELSQPDPSPLESIPAFAPPVAEHAVHNKKA